MIHLKHACIQIIAVKNPKSDRGSTSGNHSGSCDSGLQSGRDGVRVGGERTLQLA